MNHGPSATPQAAGAEARMYRIKVEERGRNDGEWRQTLVLHVYRDGVEAETIEFDLTDVGARTLVDEMRWLEWHEGAGAPAKPSL